MRRIHPTSIIGPNVQLGDNIVIGPNCVIGTADIDEDLRYRDERREFSDCKKNTKIGNDVKIGANSYIGIGTTLEQNVICQPNSFIGHFTKIGSRSEITFSAQIHNGVIIGENCWIGGFVCNRAVIENDVTCLGRLVHKLVDASRHQDLEQSPHIEEGAIIGMNATVIGGVRVGRRAYIAASAVLTHDASAERLYLGNPARDSGSAPEAFKKT